MTNLCATNVIRILQSADKIRARLSGEFSSVHGLSVGEFLLMKHLEKPARHRLSRVELAKRMHISASTVTRMAAPLEKLGLLDREADVRDARLAFVVLTDTGLQRLSEAQATFEKQCGYVFQDRWHKEELEGFSNLLHRLVADIPGELA